MCLLAVKPKANNDVNIKKTGSVVINIFLNISLRPEGFLHHLCKFMLIFP